MSRFEEKFSVGPDFTHRMNIGAIGSGPGIKLLSKVRKRLYYAKTCGVPDNMKSYAQAFNW